MVTLRTGPSIDMDDGRRGVVGGMTGGGGGGGTHHRRVGVGGMQVGGVGGGVPMIVGPGGTVGPMVVGGGPQQVEDLMSMGALNGNPAANNTRPPSTTSVSSSTGSGAPRIATTSRRGGRTRARSPVVSTSGRLSANGGGGPDSMQAASAAAVGAATTGVQVVSSDNPSSAAAAAAAAAKQFKNGNVNSNSSMMNNNNNNSSNNAPGGRGGQWPPQQQQQDRSNGYNRGNNSNGRGPGGPHMHRGPSMMGGSPPNIRGGRYGGGGGYDGYGDHQQQHGGPYGGDARGGGSRYSRPYDGGDMRGPVPMGGPRGGGGSRYPGDAYGNAGGYPSNNREQQQQQSHSARSSPVAPKNSHHRSSPMSAGGRNMGGGNNSVSGNSVSSGAGTTMVIGGTKPIHVPKTDPLPAPAERPTRASAASVFRRGSDGGDTKNSSSNKSSSSRGGRSPTSTSGAPTQTAAAAAAAAAATAVGGSNAGNGGPSGMDDDSPQKILMSLRTPTSSFEEKKEADGASAGGPKTTGLTLSPDDPPQMSNTQQRAVELFERTPEQNRNIAPIDNNPSFVLFNSSFDSFGGDYFNVEASLNTDSFGGMVRTSSIADNDGSTQILQSSLSGGNMAQMLAPSASGHLTIGYSPVNSFGNVSAAAPTVPLRTASNVGAGGGGSNTMLLGGGPEVLSPTAPPQALGIYRSYSGAGPNGPRPLDDSHLRMSVGSFGAQSMSYGAGGGGGGGGRPFGENNNTITVSNNNNPSSCSGPFNGSNNNNQGSYYGVGQTRSQDGVGERMPAFYIFLKKYKTAFKDCSFLLPGLKAALLESPLPNKDTSTSEPYRSNPIYGDPTPHDLSVSRRRVQCSVCAFGGNHNNDGASQTKQDDKGSSANTIFRGQGIQSSQESATVTPSSSTGSPPRSSFTSRQRMKYEEELPSRYYENESRLSWEFEDNPPVEVSRDEDSTSGKSGPGSFGNSGSKDDKDKSGDQFCRSVGDSSGKRLNSSSPQQPKMRYRCKLCGQPKQNHTCPYQQSLARSIGIMVYPAVNAFTAAEPGSIAPALSEMNNFIDAKDFNSVSENSPGRPTPERMRPSSTAPLPSAKQVTPESARSSPRLTAPTTPPGRAQNRRQVHGRRSGSSRSGKKRSHSRMNGTSDEQGDLLFVEPMDLRPQQFLTISTSKALSAPDAYSYPALPLPYAQRKRLSDNLFSLSNEVPKLTDECAQVLREAREKDMWDLAVAELMTQVIVVIHCRDGDHRFEGLRQYLLTLGIAC